MKIGPKTPIKEISKKYENSKKPAERQSDRHGCFLKTTGNLILIFLTTKILKIGPKIWRKCEKYKNNQKPAKNESNRNGCFIVNYAP